MSNNSSTNGYHAKRLERRLICLQQRLVRRFMLPVRIGSLAHENVIAGHYGGTRKLMPPSAKVPVVPFRVATVGLTAALYTNLYTAREKE